MRPQDNDKLIACVLSRPAIWDKREKSHSNRSVVDKCWKEIAGEMDVDENLLRKKWKYLREQFCVELGKISLVYPGDEGSNPESIKWPYFRPLWFLKDVVKPRQTVLPSSSNLCITVPVDPSSFIDSNGDVKDEPQDDQGSEPDFTLGLQETPQPTPILSSRKRRYPSDNTSCYEMDKKIPRYMKTSNENKHSDDEDLLFFRSLLPHIRHIRPAQKLLLRRKILQVVSQLVYPQGNSDSE